MTYPKSLKAAREAALEYWPNVAAAEEAYGEAIGEVSPRNLVVGVYSALKDAEGLDDAGRALLAGAAQICAVHGFVKPPTEALEVFAAVLPTLPEDPAPPAP